MNNHEKMLNFTSNQVVANKKHNAFLLSHHYYQLCCLWIFMCMSSMHMHTQFYWESKGHRAWCWERLKAGEEGKDRGWDGRMASPTQWTWVWASSRSWWRTGRPAMLQFMGLQRVGHDWATELNWGCGKQKVKHIMTPNCHCLKLKIWLEIPIPNL